jgi:aspartate racemase
VKTLGLIGGMSWESTAIYYRRLNELVRARLGGQHSAKLVLVSVDFAPIVEMQAEGRWDEATAVMIEGAHGLEAAGAEAILICANTMHRMADEVAAAVTAPLIHVADVTAAAIRAAGVRRPLLLATRFTMEQAFYRDRLRRRDVEAVVPDEAERTHLHAIIFDELVQGRFEPASKAALVAMVEAAVGRDGVDGVIFGCTEIGLLIEPREVPVRVFDTLELHAQVAVDFALG